jgi:hypothetical protein
MSLVVMLSLRGDNEQSDLHTAKISFAACLKLATIHALPIEKLNRITAIRG